jgi:hypothetical protein
MQDFEDMKMELPFKILHQNGESFMCDLNAEEFKDLGQQNCWRLVSMEDAGIR